MRAPGLEEGREEAVVRADEAAALRIDDAERAPRGPDAGIHDREVDGVRREPGQAGLERERAGEHVEGRDLVGDVDDARVGERRRGARPSPGRDSPTRRRSRW